MGVERAVTRWYVQRQLLLDEIAVLQAKLANQQTRQNQQNEPSPGEEQTPGDGNMAVDTQAKGEIEANADIERKYAEAQARLIDLGPCPKTMMG